MQIRARWQRVAVALSVALVSIAATGQMASGEEPTPPEPAEVVVPVVVPVTIPVNTVAPTTTTTPVETGEVDGVEVAVGLPPIPPLAPPTEVGIVDGVEVAVGAPPVPPTTERVSGQGQSVAGASAPSAVVQRIEAVAAATQLIESMQTIEVLLDAWA